MVPLDLFSLVGVRIFKWSTTSQSTVLIELEKSYFDRPKCAASIEKAARKWALRKTSINGVLKARLKDLLSDTGSARKTRARYVSFQLLGDQKHVSMHCVVSDMDPRKKKEQIWQAQDNKLKTEEGSKEL